jgi:hypothetical protein
MTIPELFEEQFNQLAAEVQRLRELVNASLLDRPWGRSTGLARTTISDLTVTRKIRLSRAYDNPPPVEQPGSEESFIVQLNPGLGLGLFGESIIGLAIRGSVVGGIDRVTITPVILPGWISINPSEVVIQNLVVPTHGAAQHTDRRRTVPISGIAFTATTAGRPRLNPTDNNDFWRLYFVVPNDWVSGTNVSLHVAFREAGEETNNARLEEAFFSWVNGGGETVLFPFTAFTEAFTNSARHTRTVTLAAANVSTARVYEYALRRLGADALDTLTVPVEFLGAWLEYTADS